MSVDPKKLLELAANAALEQTKNHPVVSSLGQILALAEQVKKDITPVKVSRPDWDDYFLNIAKAVAERGDCSRRPTGAVIVNNRRVVSTGYNGTPPGGPSCLAGECPRAKLTSILHGDPDYSNCIALHAEQNAIAHANWSETNGATIYLTSDPCNMCSKLIRAAGITRVVHGEPLNGTEASAS